MAEVTEAGTRAVMGGLGEDEGFDVGSAGTEGADDEVSSISSDLKSSSTSML